MARQVRVAVLGAGWWSQAHHLPNLSKNKQVSLVAIVEPSRNITSAAEEPIEQADQLTSRYGVPVFESMAQLLAAKLPLDAVVVGTKHATHYELGAAALKAGLHVFIEKPMTTDPAEAALLHTLARHRGNIFMVNNTANWREKTRIAQKWVADGRLGRVQHVSCSLASPLLWIFDQPGSEGWCVPSGTMLGNGFAWGQLSHTLAWVIRVTDLVPATVYAEMSYSERTGADLYDSAIVRCTNGATINVQGAAKPSTSFTDPSKDIVNHIYGTEGVLNYSGDDKDPSSGALTLFRHDGGRESLPGFEFEDCEVESNNGLGPDSLLAFIAACAGEADVWNGCDSEVGFRVVAVLDAMYRSAKAGMRVACAELGDGD